MALFREVGQLYVAAVSRCRRNGLNDTRSVRQIRLRRRGTGDPGLELHIKTLAPGHPCGHPRSSAGKEQVTGKHPSKRPAGDDCLSTTPSPRHLFFDAIFPIRPPRIREAVVPSVSLRTASAIDPCSLAERPTPGSAAPDFAASRESILLSSPMNSRGSTRREVDGLTS